MKHLCLQSHPPGNLTDPCPTSLIWYLAISWDSNCYHCYQEFKWHCPYLLRRNAVLFLLCKGPWNKLQHPAENFLLLYSLYWKGLQGQKIFLGTGHCCMSGNFWKRKLPVMSLWLLPLPGCSERVSQVKLWMYSQTFFSLVFTPEENQSATFKSWIFTWQRHDTGGTVLEPERYFCL